MKTPKSVSRKMFQASHRARGVALLFALLLLVVLTILGVATMSNVAMQERMAGNVNLQTLAFEAASAGVAESLAFGFDKDSNWPTDAVCTRGMDEPWIGPWASFTAVPIPGLPEGIEVGYRQRVGCFDPDFTPASWNDADFSVPVQLLVLNQGIARVSGSGGSNGGIGEVLSMRDIEVRIENRGGDPTCAISVMGPLNLPGHNPMPNSANFAVDGGDSGCPIMTQFPEGAQDIIDALEGNGGNSLVGQYTPTSPGIHAGPGDAPWNDPVQLATAANLIKLGLRNYQVHSGNVVAYQDSYCVENGEASGCDAQDIENPSEPFAWCPGDFRDFHTKVAGGGNCGGGNTNSWHELPTFTGGIYYIAGNLRMGGNATGSGTVVVEGDICWNGTSNFEGTIVGLGGSFEMKGGGGNVDKATTKGMLRLGNIKNRLNPDPWPGNEWPRQYDEEVLDTNGNPMPFGAGTLDLSGGGKHEIRFDCDEAEQNVAAINQCLPPDEQIPVPGCGPEYGGFRRAIASWREYIDGQRWNEN